MTKTIVRSTGSRPIRFNGFLINPGEEKELPCCMDIPEEYKNHVNIVRIEKEKKLIIDEKPLVMKEERDLHETEEIFHKENKTKRRNK